MLHVPLRLRGTKTAELSLFDFVITNPPQGWQAPKFGGKIAAQGITPSLGLSIDGFWEELK